MSPTEAQTELRNILRPDQTIYTILRHVSRSGMHRRISLLVHTPDGMRQLDWLIASAGWGKTSNRGEGLIAGGCGVDMGFHLVYGLGRRVWPEGTPEAHGTRNGAPDRDGGYALKHSWL